MQIHVIVVPRKVRFQHTAKLATEKNFRMHILAAPISDEENKGEVDTEHMESSTY